MSVTSDGATMPRGEGPPRHTFRSADGLTWRYDVYGSGPPLLAVHGLASDSSAWDLIAARLSNHQVYSVDLPGYSLRSSRVHPPSLATLALGLDELMQTQGVDRYALLGHSMGAAVALHVALMFPRQISAMVLIAPGGLGPGVHPVLRLMGTRAGQELLGISYRLGLDKRAGAELPAHTKAAIRSLKSRAARAQLRRAIRKVLESNTEEARDSFQEVTSRIPTLVLWGVEEAVLPADHFGNINEYLPGAQIVTIPRAAHAPHRTQPEATADVIRDFIDPQT